MINEELKAAIKEAVREAIAEEVLTLQYDGWMTIAEAARYVKRAIRTLEKLVRKRQIPFHRGGKRQRILFRKSELDQWIISQDYENHQTQNIRERFAHIVGTE